MDQKVKEEDRDQREMRDCSDLKVRKDREVTQENRVCMDQKVNKAEMERKVRKVREVREGFVAGKKVKKEILGGSVRTSGLRSSCSRNNLMRLMPQSPR